MNHEQNHTLPLTETKYLTPAENKKFTLLPNKPDITLHTSLETGYHTFPPLTENQKSCLFRVCLLPGNKISHSLHHRKSHITI